jgi:uncharacterized protein YneF (UPF0154 family)
MRTLISIVIAVFFLVQYDVEKIIVCETRECAEKKLSEEPWKIEQVVKVEFKETGVKASNVKIKSTRVFSLEE